MCGAVLLTLFKINRPRLAENLAAEKKFGSLVKFTFFSLVLSKRTNCFQSMQTQNLSKVNFFVVCILKEKKRQLYCFEIRPQFDSFWENTAPIRPWKSLADHFFTRPLLSCGQSFGQLVTLTWEESLIRIVFYVAKSQLSGRHNKTLIAS
jgi:hypothetical protein